MSDFDIFKDLGITAEDMQKLEAREKELAGTRKPGKKYRIAIGVENAINDLAKSIGGYVVNEHPDSLAMVRQLKFKDSMIMSSEDFHLLKTIMANVDDLIIRLDDTEDDVIVLHFIIRDVFTYDTAAN